MFKLFSAGENLLWEFFCQDLNNCNVCQFAFCPQKCPQCGIGNTFMFNTNSYSCLNSSFVGRQSSMHENKNTEMVAMHFYHQEFS